MAIKLVPFSPGTLIKSSEANGHNNLLFNNEILTKIEQLIDRDVTRSNDKVSPFVEAYVNASGAGASPLSVNGRKSSVTDFNFALVTSNYASNSSTDYNYNNPLFCPIMNDDLTGDTEINSNFSNPSNVFNFDYSTNASISNNQGHVGKTFSARHIDYVYVSLRAALNTSGSGNTYTIFLEKYDGSVWTTIESQAINPGSVGSSRMVWNRYVILNESVQGIRVRTAQNNTNGTRSCQVYSLYYGSNFTEGSIAHTIPAGTFSPTVSSGVAAVKIVDWEDGASLQWRATNQYITGDPFVIIEATSISSVSDFSINNCVIRNISSGKWVLYCTSGTNEVKRAQIYKTLFYGTNGSNPRASSTYITGITALKTSVSRDVGKQAHFAQINFNTLAAGTRTYTGTFVNTSTNLSCSSWSYAAHTWLGSTVTSSEVNWEKPSGTILNQVNPSGTASAVNDETGTDTTSDETNNPATCRLYLNWVGSGSNIAQQVRTVILCEGDIAWVQSGGTASNIDFLSDNSIPVFTSTTETINQGDTGLRDFNISGDTAYAKISEFTAFTIEPTEFVVKLIPKETDPQAGYPSINGAGIILT